MNFVTIDYVFGIVIIIFAIIAMIKGFVDEVFGKAAWVLGLLGGFIFYADIAAVLNQKIENLVVCNILAFLMLFIFIFLIVKLIGALLEKIFTISVLKSLDKALGLMFGIVEGFTIVALIIFLLKIQPFFDSTVILDGSFFNELTQKIMSSPTVQELKA